MIGGGRGVNILKQIILSLHAKENQKAWGVFSLTLKISSLPLIQNSDLVDLAVY